MILEFYKPQSIEEAVKFKNSSNQKNYFIGGGTELNSLIFRNSDFNVISIENLGFDKLIAKNDYIEIGSSVTIQNLIESEISPLLLKSAAKQIVNRNIRNIATIGGNIGSNKSCSNLLPGLICLDANLTIATASGKSDIPVLEYISKEINDLIIKINVPKKNLNRKFALKNYTRNSTDISIITSSVSLFLKNEVIESPIIAVGGVGKHIIRLTSIENLISQKKLPEKSEIENEIKKCINPISDFRGSSEFKKHIAAVFTADCLYKSIQ
ncbi:FAD binding domain-containing protein [Candidatus Dependentiae bacterium]|nr:FAD binding domain-containing protein [Candidatus Dependentiae bacterium]